MCFSWESQSSCGSGVLGLRSRQTMKEHKTRTEKFSCCGLFYSVFENVQWNLLVKWRNIGNSQVKNRSKLNVKIVLITRVHRLNDLSPDTVSLSFSRRTALLHSTRFILKHATIACSKSLKQARSKKTKSTQESAQNFKHRMLAVSVKTITKWHNQRWSHNMTDSTMAIVNMLLLWQ